MSVVKSVALGASLMGLLVTPTLAEAGSMRGSHHAPERSHRAVLPDGPAPTSLVIAAPTPFVPPAPTPPVAPVRIFSQENLAMPGTSTPAQTFASYSLPTAAATTPLTLGVTTGGNLAPPLVSYTPAPMAASVAPPVMTPIAAPSFSASAPHTIDALINFGQAPYSEAQSLTTGTPQSWILSPAVQSVFNGTPTPAQQSAFMGQVLGVVQQTYNLAGLPINLTTDPNQNYAHTLSVVAGTSYPGNPNAIGITDVGNDGFSFIDKFNVARSPQELALAVGKNVAHELMHAFGITGHPDQSGTYLDAASANWSTLTSAQTTFSPTATQMLAAQNFLSGPGKEFTQGSLGLTGLEILTEHHVKTCHCPLCNALHVLEASEGLSVSGDGSVNVPEPTTVALWTVGGIGGLVVRRRRRPV